MSNENFKIKLNRELSSLKDPFIILLNTNSKDYFDSVLETLKFLTDKGMGGVYMTSARPYNYLTETFRKQDIETRNLFFIDTVSCMAGKSPGEQGRCVFIENPTALEEAGMWTDTLMDRVGTENKFLIVDSLSNLLIYNDTGTLKRFSQFLIDRLRSQRASGVLASIDMEIPESLYEALNDLCDKTIEV